MLIIAGWNDASDQTAGRDGVHTYFALTLAVEGMVLISLVSLDVLLFYVFFEAMLIPMYFLIGGFGQGTAPSLRGRGEVPAVQPVRRPDHARRGDRAVCGDLTEQRFGGHVRLPPDRRRGIAAAGSTRSPAVMKLLFLGFMFAFAVKAPLWPFHRWLPDAAVEATPASAVLMMAVMDKVGTFGMLRYCLQLFPDASPYFRPLIITLAVIGVDLRRDRRDRPGRHDAPDRLHVDIPLRVHHPGHLRHDQPGPSGSTLYMVNHGHLDRGAVPDRRIPGLPQRQPGDNRLRRRAEGRAGSGRHLPGRRPGHLSLPGLAPFISEFLVLLGTFNRYWLASAFGVTALVFAAIYMLWLYQRMMTGPVAKGNERIADLRPRELIVVAPLIALLLVLGVYPKPVWT